MARLEIKPATWGKDGKGWRYQSILFTLESNALKTRSAAAYHLEQIYTAYARSLRDTNQAEPTAILLAVSQPDYQSAAQAPAAA
jgi:hypothetical protein